MKITVYTNPKDLEKFKNFEKIPVYPSPCSIHQFKLVVNMEKIEVIGGGLEVLEIKRYSPSEMK